MSVQLSRSFHLSEFTRSSTARAYGMCGDGDHCIDPTLQQVVRVTLAAHCLYQPLRERFGRMVPTGGIRSSDLNAILPGASDTSAHLTGDGADFAFLDASTGAVMAYLEAGHLPFDQAILYPDLGHIHLGHVHPVTHKQRRELLTSRGGRFYLWSSR